MLKLKNKKKIALVLSGGGIKAAAFHVGVCLALQEKGFKFIGGTRDRVEESPFADDPLAIKTYVGSSAGALICAFLASGHQVEDIIQSFEMGTGLIKKSTSRKPNLKAMNYFDIFYLNSPSFSGLWSFIKRNKSLISGGLETLIKNNFKVNGLFSARGMEKYLRKHVLPTNSFAELGVEFYSIATFLNHSRKAIFGQTPPHQVRAPEISYLHHASISDAVSASLSLPPVFTPYPIKNPDGEDIYYFDGEIRDTLSTHVAADCGADLVIASYSIQPYHYTREVGSLSDYGIPIIINQALYQVVEQKIISSIKAREDIRSLINMVKSYFKENGLPPEHAEKLVEAMSKRVNYRKEVDYVYIHPKAQNYEMFFVDHFSLSPAILGRIVKIGFKSAINVLRKYDI
jgi:predicted acylesterase/phospholipase RssA